MTHSERLKLEELQSVDVLKLSNRSLTLLNYLTQLETQEMLREAMARMPELPRPPCGNRHEVMTGEFRACQLDSGHGGRHRCEQGDVWWDWPNEESDAMMVERGKGGAGE